MTNLEEATQYLVKNYLSQDVWKIEVTGDREISVYGLEEALQLVPDLYDQTYIVKFPCPISERPIGKTKKKRTPHEKEK